MPTSQSTAPDKPTPVPLPKTVSHMLGEIVWLMTQSPLHRHFALADLEWMLMPALLLNQYRVFHDQGRPVGAALWAFLSEEIEAKLSLTPPRLRPDEWKSGDQCWLVDLIVPNATDENQLVGKILADLKQTPLRDRVFRFRRTNPTTGKQQIVTVG